MNVMNATRLCDEFPPSPLNTTQKTKQTKKNVSHMYSKKKQTHNVHNMRSLAVRY